MTHDPDGTNPEDTPEGSSTGHAAGGDRKLDEDAAWRAIIDNYGDEPAIDEYYPSPADTSPSSPVEPVDTSSPDAPPAETNPRFTVFDRRWNPDPVNSEATWDDEGHFVPPNPPPPPKLEPRRKLAWIGLFGAPLLMLIAVVLGWQYPGWVGLFLVGSFLGGFGYLVATMPRGRPEDGSGDDGAVV
jgi:hypothetical protein